MITAHWTPTREDVHAAARTARLSAPFAVRHATRLSALIMLVAGAVVAAVFHVYALLGAPVGLLLVSLIAWEPVIWDRNAYIRQPVEATVSADDFRMVGTGRLPFTSIWPWSSFRYAVETPELFVLVGAKERTGFVPYLPVRAVADPDAVRALLAEHLPVRPG